MPLVAKLLYLFDRRDKIRALGLFLLMLIGAGFEATSVALIFPFIALIANPSAVQQHKTLGWFYEASGLTSTRHFLILCGISLFLIFVIKIIYLSLLYHVQYRFIFNRQVTLSRRLLRAYLYSPYTFHLQSNSAELLRNINSEILWIFSGILVPAFTIIIETLIVIVIIAVLIAVEPLPALGALLVIGGACAVIYRAVRRKAGKMGVQQQMQNALMIKWVNQSLGSIKETKVLGHETFFLDHYTRSSTGYAQAMRFVRTASELPRLTIEGIMVGGMILILVLILARDQDVQRVLPTLGLFAVAAIRLMPSMNRIMSGLTTIRCFAPSIDLVYGDLKRLEGYSDVTAEARARQAVSGDKSKDELHLMREIELQDISYQYPGAAEKALQNINLVIPKGRSVAFVGPSGAGKTTIVDIILGLLTPTKGRVLVDGVSIQQNVPAWQKNIGYIPQPIYIFDDTIRRNVTFGISDELIDDGRVWQALQAAQLEQLVKSLPEQLDTCLGEHGVRLSAGQRQRVGIARALYYDPEVLVLDEATAALDYETEEEITKAVAQLSREKTVIIIAHRLTTVRNCNILFFIKNGRVTAAASYNVLLETSKDFQNMVAAASQASGISVPLSTKI